MMRDGAHGEAALLAACYRNSLAIAAGIGAAIIAFPGISTGVYAFPAPQAAEIAVATVRASLQEETSLREVIFCCFSEKDLALYQHLLNNR